MGRMILESSVDFAINRKLTNEELTEVINYCGYDVDTTIDIYKMRAKDYFEIKDQLVEMLPEKLQRKAHKWNTTTISANVLLEKPLPRWSDIRLGEYDPTGNYEMLKRVPCEVADMWTGKGKKKKTKIQKFGCSIEFGFGGLHGVNDSRKKFENVKLLDVASMYPHIILELNVLGQATDTYRRILEERIKVKHTNKVLSDALKLVLNSVYGNLNAEYSLLYNPRALDSVCIYGQIALFELCKRLSETCSIVNVNTDGVAFTTNSDAYLDVWKEWEKDFNLTLEEENFEIWIQNNVNNYVAVQNGQIKNKKAEM
ncbi:hypothetical protein [Listeria fleischmannii]|uniref:hypothetical protein n=1 Tax=Listeria fleischmannii TaxID=1069827 RepID=UPI0004B7D0BC|nr:hypothetical protein [Listeria fleischmannii]